MLLLFADGVLTAKRQSRCGSTSSSLGNQKVDALSRDVDTFFQLVKGLRKDLLDFFFSVQVQLYRGATFSPIQTKQQMDCFLFDDGHLEERKLALEQYLYTLVSPKMTASQLGKSLLYGVFHRSYIQNHKWPNPS